MNNQPDHRRNSAFTIVELLIVVVVIAILAAIVIVSYNGITSAAEESKLKADLDTISKNVSISKLKDRQYPVSVYDTDISDGSMDHIQYAGSTNTFCAIATTKSGKQFSVTNKGHVREGYCDNVTPEECFEFTSSTGTLRSYYRYNNPSLCPDASKSSNGADIVIPRTIGGVEVKTIGNSAFWDYANKLTSVVVPDTVEVIEHNAFRDNLSMKSIYIPDSVTTIGERAFQSGVLESIRLSNNIVSLGYGAFRFNNIKSITLPSTLRSVGSYAFTDNPIEEIVIPDGMEDIGMDSFAWIKGLKRVKISNTVKTIGVRAFEGSEVVGYVGIEDLDLGSSVQSIGSDAFRYNSLSKLNIPDSVTSIGVSAFAHNNLGSVSLPSRFSSQVSTPGNYFYDNPNLSFTVRP